MDRRRITAGSAPALLLALTLFAPGALRAQEAGPLDAEARASILDAVCERLERAYVLPDVAERMAADLRARAADGTYDEVGDPEAFASLLTEHLQGVSHDRHLRVRAGPPPRPVRPSGTAAGGARSTPFGRVERLDGDVAYVEILSFAFPTGPVRAEVARVMGAAADARALVIDLRANGGGRPELVALIASYLFGDEPVLLNRIYDRVRDATQEFSTDPGVAGARFGLDKPVYVLTSSRTFSGAEEFAYDLQAQERAMVVGETTGGGANPGGFVGLPHGLGIFVPTGRAINPITGTNWEGVGVVPDVAVPAGEALEAALRLARGATDGGRMPEP